MRAVVFLNCWSVFDGLRSLRCCRSVMFSRMVGLSGKRLLRHCPQRRCSAISAVLSHEQCVGVQSKSRRLALLARLVEAGNRPLRILGPLIDVEVFLHARYDLAVLLGWVAEALVEPWLDFTSVSTSPTVERPMLGRMRSSTIRTVSRSSVHLARPQRTWLHAMITIGASTSSVIFRTRVSENLRPTPVERLDSLVTEPIQIRRARRPNLREEAPKEGRAARAAGLIQGDVRPTPTRWVSVIRRSNSQRPCSTGSDNREQPPN